MMWFDFERTRNIVTRRWKLTLFGMTLARENSDAGQLVSRSWGIYPDAWRRRALAAGKSSWPFMVHRRAHGYPGRVRVRWKFQREF